MYSNMVITRVICHPIFSGSHDSSLTLFFQDAPGTFWAILVRALCDIGAILNRCSPSVDLAFLVPPLLRKRSELVSRASFRVFTSIPRGRSSTEHSWEMMAKDRSQARKAWADDADIYFNLAREWRFSISIHRPDTPLTPFKRRRKWTNHHAATWTLNQVKSLSLRVGIIVTSRMILTMQALFYTFVSMVKLNCASS